MSRHAFSRRDQAPTRLARAALFFALAACLEPARAYTVNIAAGTRALFLQVGNGTMSGGTFSSGLGTPGNNATINEASVSVPAASIGSGTAFAMTTNSTVTNSPFDGFNYCTPSANGQVYVGGFYRVPGLIGANATLTVSAPPNLLNETGSTLPFSTIAWTSGGTGDTAATIPSGTFSSTGGATTLLSVARNTWFESCLAFRYLNTQLVPGGTYTGRATYTLTAP